jgi:penicillin-binding protein 2
VIEAPLQRRAPLPPQLTRRVGVLGVLAFVLFGILVFRLWFLQVLTGTQNAAQATENVQRDIAIPPPRGNILSSDGQMLATYRNATEVAIVGDDLPAGTAAQTSLYMRLGALLGVKWQSIRRSVRLGIVEPGYAPTPVAYNVSERTLAYLGERKRYYPGVVERSVPVRDYPQGDIGSVVLGQVGQITGPGSGVTSPELGMPLYKGITAGSTVGQSGLEAEYQPYLQGTPGAEKVKVDAAGDPVAGQEPQIQAPIAGDQLVTSLDLGLEREGYIAIRQAQANARTLHNPATAAAFVAMDPNTGRVLGLGSVPTYNANDFATPISQSTYSQIGSAHADIDRAVDTGYPTGSTFKPITALAALGAGLITPSTLQGAGSSFTIGSGAQAESFRNSGGADYPNVDLVNALAESVDTYFYPLGASANVATGDGGAIQAEARKLGLGGSPGIDLPGGGFAGIVPDANWVVASNKQYVAQSCDGSRPKPAYAHDQLAINGCALGYLNPPWTVGQNIQLATGQGFFEATPLQMAIAYSAIFNNGTVWSPRIGEEILSPSGKVVQQLPPPQKQRQIYIDSSYRAAVMAGLHAAAQSPGGTSDAVFANFPYPVYGKTGTAQHTNAADQSWYVAYVPDGARSIVVAVTIEQGGFGAAAAAPAARLILSQWFGVKKQFIVGSSTDL